MRLDRMLKLSAPQNADAQNSAGIDNFHGLKPGIHKTQKGKTYAKT